MTASSRPHVVLMATLVALALTAGSARAAGGTWGLGMNAFWMPASAAFGVTKPVDDVLDAAQRLGLRIVRVWGFNTQLPAAPGVYDAGQARGLDYVIAGARRRGLRVIVALGNFWATPYGGAPENWLAWAEGSAAGKTVADFYSSPRVRELYRAHIVNSTARTNSLTGVPYNREPAILGYDVLNEPRCPGCSSADMAARSAFLTDMVAALRTAAPGQLALSSSEGFFTPHDPNVAWNPGAGAQCEGEDWAAEARLFDVATVHLYYRHLERMAVLGWQRPTFERYVQFLAKKLQLFTDLAAGKPLLVEEFGLTSRSFGDEERKVVFAVVAGALIAAKRAGRPLVGALFWNAAAPGQPDGGGYSVDLTCTPSGATIGLGGSISSSSSSSSVASKAAGSDANQSSSSSPPAAPPSFPVQGRRLRQLVVAPGTDTLDAFRRGAAREACAHAAAGSWQPATPPPAVNVAAYRAAVAGVDVVDILREAAQILNSG